MNRLLALFAWTVVLVASIGAEAGLTLDPAQPVIGEAGTITVTGEADTAWEGVPVTAVYYPNSAVERHTDLGLTDAQGQVAWTPEHAGLVTVGAADESTTVGVRFTGLPIRGLIVFLIAGTLLFGFIAFGTRRILQAEYVDPTT